MPELTPEQIGDADHPLRASGLTYLNCSLRFWLSLMAEGRSTAAANTGTLLHVGVEQWLRGSSLSEAVRAMEARNKSFRAAGEETGSLPDATRWLEAYTQDPRNAPLGQWPADESIGRVIAVEEPVAVKLQPAAFDPTHKEIWIAGTFDQLRERRDGSLHIWDLKTSNLETMEPHVLTHYYAMQTVVYAAGAEQMLGKPVSPGGLILTRSYGARKAHRKGVFFDFSLSRKHIKMVLESVAERVALIRSGILTPNISMHCTKCYVTSGPSECLTDLARIVS